MIEPVDPAQTFAKAKKAADDARAVLVAERANLKTADKARRAELHVKLAAIDKLLGRPPVEQPRKAKAEAAGVTA